MRAVKSFMLLAGLAGVFLCVLAVFRNLMPAPHDALDTLVMGTGATVVCQLALFAALAVRQRQRGGTGVWSGKAPRGAKDGGADQRRAANRANTLSILQ